jgi:hypothetical protein
MDTTKVIVTLLILTIVLSVATVAFNALSGGKTVTVNHSKGADTATVGLFVEGGAPAADKATVGLSVVDNQ